MVEPTQLSLLISPRCKGAMRLLEIATNPTSSRGRSPMLGSVRGLRRVPEHA